MNTELLLQVKDSILKHPNKFDMREWKCGTAMCIGGWAFKLSKLKVPLGWAFDGAAGLLSLTYNQADRLFMIDKWPRKFHDAYYKAAPLDRAKVAADRIDHFIKRKV